MRNQVEGQFVEINCATIRGDAAMSALFGHKKGAFTGAASDRVGLLRTANGGMLFLDEIGELGLDEQAMILRAVEEKCFLPVGSDVESTSDFQLIAGTNRDLQDAISEGRFREDLLARLNLWTFHLPGLVDRREDIEPNLDYELRRYAETEGRQITFNKEARDKFLRFAMSEEATWSANFRDLSGSVTRMATFAEGGRIRELDVLDEMARLRRTWRSTDVGGSDQLLKGILDNDRIAALDLFDRLQLGEVIRICRSSSSLSSAGRTLFAMSRKKKARANDADRLRKYLQRFGLDWRAVNQI
jgi:transcriptional regulatory protein RtcR